VIRTNTKRRHRHSTTVAQFIFQKKNDGEKITKSRVWLLGDEKK